MTRVGKSPVVIPQGVSVHQVEGTISVKGPKGELSMAVMPFVEVAIEESAVTVTAKSSAKRARQAWGAMRALIQNMVNGVSDGARRTLEINGVGYRAQVKGKVLELQLGYSHPINVDIPEDLQVNIVGDRGNQIQVDGIDKQQVGQFASNIRGFRAPEPYKGKGIKYLEERILRKEGKKK